MFIGCCVLAFVTVGLVINSFGLFHTYIAESLGVTRTSVALTQTVQSLFSALALILSGRILQRVPLRVLTTCGAVLMTGGVMLASTFNEIYQFYFVWAGVGLSMPFLFSLIIPTVLSNWFEKRLGTVMGIAVSLTGIGGAVFNPLMAMMLQRYGWRASLFAMGAFAAVMLIPVTLFIIRLRPGPGQQPYGREYSVIGGQPVPQAVDAQQGITAKEARKMPSFYLFIVAVLFLAPPSGFFQQISPHVMSLGHPVTASAAVMSGVMFGIASGKLIIGYMLDRFKTAFVLLGFAAVGASGWIGVALAGAHPLLIICGFFAGIGHGISQVSLPVCVRRTFGTREYSKIYAVITSCMTLVASTIPTIGSFAYDMTGSYSIPLIFAGCSLFMSLPCMIIALRLAEKRGAQA